MTDGAGMQGPGSNFGTPRPTPPGGGLTRRAMAGLAAGALVIAGGTVAVVAAASGSSGPAAAHATSTNMAGPTATGATSISNPPTSDTTTGAGNIPSDPTQTTTTLPANAPWTAKVAAAMGPANDVVPALISSFLGWSAGTVTAADLDNACTNADRGLLSSQRSLAALPGDRSDPLALDDYRVAVSLYLADERLALVASTAPSGPASMQLQLGFRRISTLARTLIDTGHAAATASPLPSVPDWTALGLAPGPPLDQLPAAPPANAVAPAPLPLAAWESAVSSAGIPDAIAEATVIQSGTADKLNQMSTDLTNAAQTLAASPGPASQLEAGLRLRIGLLADAEATRTASAATNYPQTTATYGILGGVANDLARAGDALWPSQLPPRATGL